MTGAAAGAVRNLTSALAASACFAPESVRSDGAIRARSILDQVRRVSAGKLILVEGGPQSPLWGSLIDLRRGKNHLFLRYSFP
jgi:nitrogenase molybdenum-iron protein alpha/beta subunit